MSGYSRKAINSFVKELKLYADLALGQFGKYLSIKREIRAVVEAQVVAHRTTERKVLGSIPSGSWAFFLYSIRIVCPYSGRSWRYITTDFPSWQKTKGQNPNYFAPISLYAAVPIFIKVWNQ